MRMGTLAHHSHSLYRCTKRSYAAVFGTLPIFYSGFLPISPMIHSSYAGSPNSLKDKLALSHPFTHQVGAPIRKKILSFDPSSRKILAKFISHALLLDRCLDLPYLARKSSSKNRKCLSFWPTWPLGGLGRVSSGPHSIRRFPLVSISQTPNCRHH